MNNTPGYTPEPATDDSLVYDNRSLFSDYYLRERLSDHDVWSEDVTAAFEAARRFYGYEHCSSGDRRQEVKLSHLFCEKEREYASN